MALKGQYPLFLFLNSSCHILLHEATTLASDARTYSCGGSTQYRTVRLVHLKTVRLADGICQ